MQRRILAVEGRPLLTFRFFCQGKISLAKYEIAKAHFGGGGSASVDFSFFLQRLDSAGGRSRREWDEEARRTVQLLGQLQRRGQRQAQQQQQQQQQVPSHS